MWRASHPAPSFATTGRCSIPLKIRNRNEAVASGSAAEGNVQGGDDAHHGESVAAEPDRDYRCKPDARMDIILDHDLQTKRGMMK